MSTRFNRELAHSLLEQHGSPLERARLLALTEGRLPAEAPPELAALQNPDGGFPFDLQSGRPSTLHHTALALQWLQELGLAGDPVAHGGTTFLLSRQTRRGIWRESPGLLEHGAPLWMDAESAWADVHTTAVCAGRLAGRAEAELATDRAVAWLKTQQGRDGLLEGFKVFASAAALPAFAAMLGEDARATRRLVAGLGSVLQPDWTAAMLTATLAGLLAAGFGWRTEVVERAWLQLQALQLPDGSFAAADESESPTSITLAALAIHRRLGVSNG